MLTYETEEGNAERDRNKINKQTKIELCVFKWLFEALFIQNNSTDTYVYDAIHRRPDRKKPFSHIVCAHHIYLSLPLRDTYPFHTRFISNEWWWWWFFFQRKKNHPAQFNLVFYTTQKNTGYWNGVHVYLALIACCYFPSVYTLFPHIDGMA